MSSDQSRSPSEVIKLPVFPLPNVVFFPHTLLPLFIFEPRYRRMVEDVLAARGPLGIVLKKGRSTPSEGDASDTYEVGAFGEITEYRALEDGNYQVLVSGKSRYRILALEQTSPYRVARASVLEDPNPDPDESREVAAKLIRAFLSLRTREQVQKEQQVLPRLDFPTLVNSICASIQIGDHTKQMLLEINHLQIRAEKALAILEEIREKYRMIAPFEHLKPQDPKMN